MQRKYPEKTESITVDLPYLLEQGANRIFIRARMEPGFFSSVNRNGQCLDELVETDWSSVNARQRNRLSRLILCDRRCRDSRGGRAKEKGCHGRKVEDYVDS
jgi:hypothetical protein